MLWGGCQWQCWSWVARSWAWGSPPPHHLFFCPSPAPACSSGQCSGQVTGGPEGYSLTFHTPTPPGTRWLPDSRRARRWPLRWSTHTHTLAVGGTRAGICCMATVACPFCPGLGRATRRPTNWVGVVSASGLARVCSSASPVPALWPTLRVPLPAWRALRGCLQGAGLLTPWQQGRTALWVTVPGPRGMDATARCQPPEEAGAETQYTAGVWHHSFIEPSVA